MQLVYFFCGCEHACVSFCIVSSHKVEHVCAVQRRRCCSSQSWRRRQAWLKSTLGSHEDHTSKTMTTTLSSSSRSPMTMVDRSLRPGTSGMLNRAWHDHPCAIVRGIARLRPRDSKALERPQVLRSKPSTSMSHFTY